MNWRPPAIELAVRREGPHFADFVVLNAIQDHEMAWSFEPDRRAGIRYSGLVLIRPFERTAASVPVVEAAHLTVAVDDRLRIADPECGGLRGDDGVHGSRQPAAQLSCFELCILDARLLA